MKNKINDFLYTPRDSTVGEPLTKTEAIIEFKQEQVILMHCSRNYTVFME